MGTEGTLTLKLRAVLEAEQKPWCVPKGSAEGSREMLRWEAAVSRGCLQGNAPWACSAVGLEGPRWSRGLCPRGCRWRLCTELPAAGCAHGPGGSRPPCAPCRGAEPAQREALHPKGPGIRAFLLPGAQDAALGISATSTAPLCLHSASSLLIIRANDSWGL